MDAHDHLALLIAVIAQNGPTPLHPDDIQAAQGLALTMWEADGAVWLRADPKPGDAPGIDATMRYDVRAQNGPGNAVVEHRPGPHLHNLDERP